MSQTILVVDDDTHIIELSQMYIEQEGYRVVSATDGQTALDMIAADEPMLVVLDLMLPKVDGWEVCKRVRANSNVPIIMVTARSDDIDKIVGLELGADDYLTKPFNPRELVARIRAILRRTGRESADEPTNSGAITVGNLKIIPDQRVVTVDGKTVELRLKEFDLLLTFAQNPRIVFSREKLLNVVWGYDFAGETRTVDMHVAHLRHKLEGMTPQIETVWGVGYKLETP
jgi:two-component system alkaline phosphatase synthesis response regulator PhoP/two-component system response regulator ResD